MDPAAALLSALRATASFGDGRVEPARVETLAGALGLDKEKLPAMVAQWQRARQVEIAWGGILEVLPEPSPSAAGMIINAQGAQLGAGAILAGRDAIGNTVTVTPEAAFGILAAVVAKLEEIRPGLQGEAAEAADNATQMLRSPPSAGAPVDTRRAWVSSAGEWLSRLLKAAPEAKDAAELAEKALKGLGWV